MLTVVDADGMTPNGSLIDEIVGALGLWKALRQVFPDTAEQRCRVHKTANVLDSAAGGEGSDRRHLQRRGQGARRRGDPGVRQAVFCEVLEGRQEDRR
jgi:hypothetical protein